MKAKRLLSFILSLCMVISLVPTFLLVSAEADPIVYSFAPNGDADLNRSVDTFTDYPATGNKWKFFGQSDGLTTKIQYVENTFTGHYLYTTGTVGDWFAIKLDVAEDGIYNINYICTGRNNNGTNYPGKATVHILPGTTALSDISTTLGSEDELAVCAPTRVSSNWKQAVAPLKTRNGSSEIELKKGEYVVVFKIATSDVANADNIGRIYPARLEFTKVLPWAPPEITAAYAGKEATKNYVFALVKNTWENPVVKLKSNQTGDQSANADLRGVTPEFTDGWYAYAWNTQYTKTHNNGYVQNRTFYQSSDGTFRLISTEIGGFHALAFPFEKTGRYDVKINYASDNKVADVFFIPMSDLKKNDGRTYYYLKLDDEVLTDEEKLIYPQLPQERIDEVVELISDDTYKIGVLDSTQYDGTAKVMSVEVKTKGDHLLVFKQTNAGTTGTIISKITFSGEYVEQEIKTNQLIPESGRLLAGENTTLSLADKFGNPITQFTLKNISSSDEDIAAVDGLNVTAGNNFGRTKVMAKVEIKGKEEDAVGYVRVIDPTDSGDRITHALDTMDNNSRGEAWINPSYYVDSSLYKNTSRANKDICGFEEGHGITADYTDGWSWYGCDENVVRAERTFFIQNGTYLSASVSKGKWFALKLNFKSAGHYRAAIEHLAYNTLGEGYVYLAPIPQKGEKVEDYLTDSYKVGYFNCYDKNFTATDEGNIERTTYLGDTYVDASGDYLLIVQGGYGTYGTLMLNNIIFSGKIPITGMKTFDAVTVGDKLTVGPELVRWETEVPEYTENCTLSYINNSPEIIDLSGNTITALKNGIGTITVTAEWGNYIEDFTLTVIVGTGKTRRTYYTDTKVKNARNNIERYDWARQTMKSVVEQADIYVNMREELWNFVTTQELPRAQLMTARFNDSGYTDCLYCGKELEEQYGSRPFKRNALVRPWKVQCPDCKRYFPSNDFEKFYKLGLDEHANWDYELALQNHHEMFVCADGAQCTCTAPGGKHTDEEWQTYYGYGVKGGYLYNDYYGEKNDPLFAVDDGWGYEYTYYFKDKNGEQIYNEDGTPKTEHRIEPFIAYYNYYGIWDPYGQGLIWKALTSLMDAYIYTGEEKYGITGAILVDRIADVYPDFDVVEIGQRLPVSDNSYKQNADGTLTGLPHGLILGKLHDVSIADLFIKAYDAFWPALKNEQTIAFLSEKAEKYGFENPKTSATAISMNIENNLLRTIHKARLERRYQGNFPTDQIMHLLAGIVLDSSPETEEWIDFEFKSGGAVSTDEYTGGNIAATIMGIVSRDGHANESSPGYNAGWVSNLVALGDILNGYDKIPEDKKVLYDIYSNPRFKRLLTGQIEILCVTEASPNIGDHDAMGRHLLALTDMNALILAFELTEDEEMKANIARYLYRLNGNETGGIHGSIFLAEPEAVVEEIEKVVDGSSAIKLQSENFAGYGYAILRAGDWFISDDTQRNVNTQRDFYIWYGMMGGHADRDKLNLVFHSYGLEVGADPGETAHKDNNSAQRFEFDLHTTSHNTVTVNNIAQRNVIGAEPMHFDDSGRVQLMDIENAAVYDWQGVEKYRRTFVMVDANDDVSYGIDFFHIIGGEDHLYSFHALGREADLSDNINVQSQTDLDGNYVGSYQGVDKGWGESNVLSVDIKNVYGGKFGVYDIDSDLGGKTDGLGTYSWFGEVDRATDPGNADVFSMDWKVDDHYKELNPPNNDLRVRLTMVNSFKLDEITTSSAIPAKKPFAIDKVRYLFARHTGANDGKAQDERLDTLFTSVVEPYDGDRYIDSIEKVKITRADGAEFTIDEAKAVKVTLENGRIDYIVYAKDTTIPYKVHYQTSCGSDASFDFSGFIGVVSMVDDKIIYSYVNDGTTIANQTGLTPAYTGKITGFQTEFSTNNYIDVKFTSDVDLETLPNTYIYVDNTHVEDNGSFRILSAEPSPDIDGSVRLNLGNTSLVSSFADKNDFGKGYNYFVQKEQSFRIPLAHVDDKAPTFNGTYDGITATAGSSVTVNVSASGEGNVHYKSVSLPRGATLDEASGTITWKPTASQIGENLFRIDAIDENGRISRTNFTVTVYGSTTSGASGGGGGDTTTSPPSAPDKDEEETINPTKPSTGNEGESSDKKVRFIDLGNHAWASDAINILADEGIIKGTSENTFSPANNITRADFAILLVRAFKLESENTENFADVAESDYFEKELAIARNTGIVNGIGDNKYAPRNTIIRQDMMVIVYRAMQKLGVELEVKDVEYADFDD
ncbi:MAG: S-layer homology domain-containing protein, partial [Oscillospiraceae bacterium]|nr:S-layer homology domain-containing protein [Oscillospiraceae bacterium]